MLNCNETTRMCSDEMERPLRMTERVALRTHLMMCDGCSQYRRQLKTLHVALKVYAQGEAVSAEVRVDPKD